MQNIDELLVQQRNLIIQMDQLHQKQVKSLQDRIHRLEQQSIRIDHSSGIAASQDTFQLSSLVQSPHQIHTICAIVEKDETNEIPKSQLPTLNPKS